MTNKRTSLNKKMWRDSEHCTYDKDDARQTLTGTEKTKQTAENFHQHWWKACRGDVTTEKGVSETRCKLWKLVLRQEEKGKLRLVAEPNTYNYE